MASIHKDPLKRSPYWYGAYYGHDGRRRFKSTKSTDRKEALKIVTAWEEASGKARSGDLTAAQARKVLAEIVAASSGESLTSYTVKGWLSEWLGNKSGGASENTMVRYKQVCEDFLELLGERADKSLAGINPGDIVKFRDELRREGRAVSTCNVVIKKILSVPFEAARKLGYILTNPVAAVDLLKVKGQGASKEPFTLDEVKALLSHSEGDWHGAILLGATTGIRLGDVVSLTYDAIDEQEGVIRITTQKTGEEVTSMIHPDFKAWLAKRQKGIGKAPIFPDLIGRKAGGANGLSRHFRKIMEKAEIVEKVTEATGDAGRIRNSKGFHSFRHTFASQLANAGISPETRQKLTGHRDAKVHAGYTHLELKTLKKATAKLPRLKSA